MDKLLLTVLVLISIDTYSQLSQPVRTEYKYKDTENPYLLFPCDTEGIALIQTVPSLLNQTTYLQIKRLDTLLTEEWRLNLTFSDQVEVRGVDYDNRKLYLLVTKNAYTNKEYRLIVIDFLTEKYEIKDFEMLVELEMSEFEVISDAAIFGGRYNYRPVVIMYHFEEDRLEVIPGLYNEYSELNHINMQDDFDRFQVVTSERLLDRRYTIGVNSYDSQGSLLWGHKVTPPEDISFTYARGISLDNGNVLIVGTYANTKSSFSRGIITAEMSPEGDQQVQYYSYGELKNFFSYMSARREKRMKRRIQRRKVKGKDLKLNYRLLVHDIVNTRDGYVVMGEAFYPKYSSYTNSTFTQYVGPRRSGQVFDGYQYTHAVVLGFDDSGELQWDNSFEISEVLSYTLDQQVFVNPNANSERLPLLYLYDNKIRTKIIQKDQVLEGKQMSDIRTNFESDEVRNSRIEFEKMEHWYDNYFVISGVQSIRNTAIDTVESTRKVFFINKVMYQ